MAGQDKRCARCVVVEDFSFRLRALVRERLSPKDFAVLLANLVVARHQVLDGLGGHNDSCEMKEASDGLPF